MNNIDKILDNIRNNRDHRWRGVGNCKHIEFGDMDSIIEHLSKDDFLGLAVMQEANMGGEYWRHFLWFNNHNPSVEPTRYCDVGSWFMPNPPFRKLTQWVEGEIVEIPEIRGKKFVTKKVQDSVYFWSVTPYVG